MDGRRENDLRRIWGILLLPLCLFIALSLFSYDWQDISVLKAPPNDPPCNLIGPVGAWLSFVFFAALGVGAYLIPVWCLVFALILIFSRQERVWPRGVWCVVLILALASILELSNASWASTVGRLNIGDTGGIFSRVITSGLLVRWLSPVGTGILLWSAFLIALIMLIGIRNIGAAGRYVAVCCRLMTDNIRTFILEHQDRQHRIEKEEREIEKRRGRLEKEIRIEERLARLMPEPVEREVEPVETTEAETVEQRSKRAEKKTTAIETIEAGTYELPPLNLLETGPTPKDKGIKTDTATMARILTETLAEFAIEAEVTDIQRGPVVTRYELLPAPGVRIERISGLSNNLALALKATSVRVQAPVPGKGVVGIEVPNTTANIVWLHEILEGEAWKSSTAKLPLALGKDVAGNDIVVDLTEMPHLLIAGTTGSGKTVCINSILIGLLMSRTPDQLRLLLADPKIVEFSVFKHLPHLVVPIVTDPKKVALGLRWAINEMEKRYKLFAKVGVRNIESYNNRVIAKQEDLFGEQQDGGKKEDKLPDKIPYIVIIIDELADLMLVAQAEIENCVARLAQLSRAVGIHMILSTQRPSVNVITGTIKANFPARIAFQVVQRVDSRTILDTIGADKLLGRGDMLFQPPGTSKLMRAQGAMVTDAIIRDVVEFIKKQAGPSYELEIGEKIETRAGWSDESEDEELLAQATEIIRETQRASTSSLQRRLRIGYTRAARIMDILEERGIVGPPRGSDPREIIIDLDGEIPDNVPE